MTAETGTMGPGRTEGRDGKMTPEFSPHDPQIRPYAAKRRGRHNISGIAVTTGQCLVLYLLLVTKTFCFEEVRRNNAHFLVRKSSDRLSTWSNNSF